MKQLLKIQMKSMLTAMKSSSGKQRGSALLIFAIVMILLSIEMIMVMTWSQLVVLCTAGLTWFYFALAGLMALALAVFGGVFMTQTQLFDAKDNELLLSMPIRPRHILLSRIAVLLCMTAVFTAAVLLPAFIMYAVTFGVTGMQVLGWVVVFLGITVLSQALCCALGWLLHKLLSNVRNKAVASLSFMVLFMIVYFAAFGNANNILASLLTQGEQIADTLRNAVWPLFAIGRASMGDALQMLLFALLCAAVCALVLWVLSASFIRMVGKNGSVGARRKTGKADMRTRPAAVAIAYKELRRFLTCPVYLTNFGLSVIFVLAIPVAAALFRDKLMESFSMVPGAETLMPVLAAAVMGFVASMSSVTSPSVSLEGKSLWVMRSLPVTGRTVVHGKLLFHLLLIVPVSTVSTGVLTVIVGGDVWMALSNAVFAAVFFMFSGLLGLVTNLAAPKFDWMSETAPCKQSSPVILTMLGCYVLEILLALLYVGLGLPSAAGVLLCAAVTAILSGGLYAALVRWGSRRFESFDA